MRAFVAQRKQRLLLGHPPGLFVLFFTEMWERFSYFGMRTLLVLYLTKHLLVTGHPAERVWGYGELERMLFRLFGPLSIQQLSSQIYGLYTGLVYLTPFFGGILADRLLNRHRCVFFGGILMAAGQFCLVRERLFLLGLLLLILGNGCFKPNIAGQVGSLYRDGDARRDGAYTIFYMGINLGAFISPFICGTLGQSWGWSWGFGVAGVGMLIGLVLYWLGGPYLAPPEPVREVRQHVGRRHPPLTRRDGMAICALAAICLLGTIFWAVYGQFGNTLQLWADERTDWRMLGWRVPSSWFQSFNPGMVLLLAPVLSLLWLRQGRRGREMTNVAKMATGLLCLGSGYLLMAFAATRVPMEGGGSILWLVGTVLAGTIGELYFSPVGLSLVAKTAPKQLSSMMIGLWYSSTFVGSCLTGYLGTFYNVIPKPWFFALLGGLAVGGALAFASLRRPLETGLGQRTGANVPAN